MSVKIRQTPYMRTGTNAGPFPVHPDLVRAQLMVIAMAGSDELPGSFGETPDPADPDVLVVNYDPGPQDVSTAAGRVRTALKVLVDHPKPVLIIGVGPDFLYSDGSTIAGSAGQTLGSLLGIAGASVFYDTHNCDGDGRWVRGTDGNEVCVTSAGILYHELGHASLGHPVGDTNADEMAAVNFENDLREAQGLVKRDPARWFESDCGCPGGGCCVVASVATGSPFSAEVHALRRVRDATLRGTELGDRFFDELHREYYSFSVAVCRVMVVDSRAKGGVERWLVRPLVRALETALTFAAAPDDLARLGRFVLDDLDDAPAGRWPADGPGLAAVHVVLSALAAAAEAPLPPMSGVVAGLGRGTDSGLAGAGAARIGQILCERLPACPHVRWAIIELLAVYAGVLAWCQAQAAVGGARMAPAADAAGARLRADLEAWLGRMPLATAAHGLSVVQLANDFRKMARTVFVTPASRRALADRLRQTADGDGDVDGRRLGRALFDAGYFESSPSPPPPPSPSAS